MVDAKELYEEQIARWRRTAFVLFIGCMVLAVFIVWSQITLLHVVDDTSNSVEILERATGPEAQASQGKVLDDLVFRIDCRVRYAIDDLLEQFDESVTIILDGCPPKKDETP